MSARARWAALRPAEPFDDDSDDDQGTVSTLPSSYTGLIVGVAMIAAVSWICTAALLEAVDPRAVVLLVTAALLALLLTPSTLSGDATMPEIPPTAAALQYGGLAALGLLGWSALLWAPDQAWAAIAAAAVLQTGYTLGVGLVALQAHLAWTAER